MKTFIPKVTPTRHAPSAAMMDWAQRQADVAYARLRLGDEGLETDSNAICASRGPVAPHRDTEGVSEGMRVIGLVLRSDGHRLNSDALHDSGCLEGLPLLPGTLYEIDPLDRHWTTVPNGSVAPELIFTVCVMFPDRRSAKTLAKDMWWTVLAASIDAMRTSQNT